MKKNLGYIGRPFSVTYSKHSQYSTVNLDKTNRVYLDFEKKRHTFIIGTTGSGKSYLAGVYAEEIISNVENCAIVILDPMGIFSTLKIPNPNADEFELWNEQLPSDIIPGRVRDVTVWVPRGDVAQFIEGSYDRTFALRAPDLTPDTFCYTFDVKSTEPMGGLYRKARAELLKESKTYTLQELLDFIYERGSDVFRFQKSTVEALMTKLDMLGELGIISDDGVSLNEVIFENEVAKVAIFNLSCSSEYTNKILVNFLAESLFVHRFRSDQLADYLRSRKKKMPYPAWYVPPIHFILDEAHEFFPGSNVLRLCIKKGRKIDFITTSITQSMDLTKDVYQNVHHVFVGPMVYDDDIASVKRMVPANCSAKDYRQKVQQLTTGSFLYYNLGDKEPEILMRVRPRRTMHPASTKRFDDRVVFIPVNKNARRKPRIEASDFNDDSDFDLESLIDQIDDDPEPEIESEPEPDSDPVPVVETTASIEKSFQCVVCGTTVNVIPCPEPMCEKHVCHEHVEAHYFDRDVLGGKSHDLDDYILEECSKDPLDHANEFYRSFWQTVNSMQASGVDLTEKQMGVIDRDYKRVLKDRKTTFQARLVETNESTTEVTP